LATAPYSTLVGEATRSQLDTPHMMAVDKMAADTDGIMLGAI
jgi:hypothetical protein